jgi:hypothetical protein
MRSRSSASASSADTAHSQLLLQLADTVAQALSLGHEQLTRAVDEALQFDRDCVEHAGRDAVLAAEHCLVRFRLATPSLRFIEPYRAAIRSSSPESVSDSGEMQR